ncbi:hypothetical protein BGZ67_008488 [Mortierella alpina]|nr:hypothetical protein BGZ67_008488 [Mortierella alpina]
MELYDVRKHRMELNTAPLTRFAYAQERDGRWILIQLLHHLIDDNTTFKLMRAETEAIMAGQDDGLQAPQPFRNLIAQARLGVSVEEHEAFFRKMLEDIDNPSLPYGLSDVHNEGQSVTESHQVLPQDLNDKLRVHAQRFGVTLASLCHLAWAMVIAAISGQTQVVFGTVLFGRMQGGSGSDRTLGPFINTLPFRVDVEDSSIVDTARRVQADLAALLEHEHASLAVAQRCSSVPSGLPLFGALLNYRHYADEVEETSTDSGMEHLGFHEGTNYPFVLYADDNGSSLSLIAKIVQPYDPSRICGYMQQALYNLAEALDHTPEAAVHSLGILPVEEYNLVVHSWNNTDALYPSDQCVHQLFEDQVEKSPDAVAIVHGDRSFTYCELDSVANHFACQLVDVGVRHGDFVALLLPRSVELVAAELAVLKVGATYVPIDVKAPVDRQAYIASDSAAKLLITNEERHIPDQIQTPVLRLSAKHEDAKETQGPVAFDRTEQPVASSLDAAYVMYTSGSTGRPKGVAVPHCGIARLVINNGFADIGPDDRVAFVANPSFDASTFDVWAPLVNGASIVIIDHDTLLDAHRLAEALDHYQITSMLLATGLFHQHVFAIGPALSKLKYLMAIGEQGLVEAFAEVPKYGGRVRVINTYGPTEATVISTTYEVTSTSGQLDRLPIGRPISNTPQYVLDKHSNPVPVGVVGELYIGGPGVAIGYLNRPDLTAQRFLPDPFSNVPGARMYKTGDLARYLPDGNIVFLGRNDDQVKIRGFRIELGEIETLLAQHPEVREVAVLALGEGSHKRLVAYVVSAPDNNLTHVLREHLAVALPEYMIPSVFVRMDAFPLTNNGKVNRRALPAPDTTSLITKGYEAPQGDMEIAMAGVWRELLKVDKIGRHDSFFMLGGHSLQAMRMIGLVRSRLGVELKMRTLFVTPTIAELAQTLSQDINSKDDEYSVLIPLKLQGGRPPLFCIHAAQGLSWSFMGLTKHLHPDQPLYGLQARGVDGKTPMIGSIEEMTRDYIQQIRKVQPHGPYHFLGWSFGGLVAQNMAVELERQGEKVSLVAMMDTSGEYSTESEIDLEEKDTPMLVEQLARFSHKDSIDDGKMFWEKMMPVFINNSNLARGFNPSVYSGDILFFRASVPVEENAPLLDPTSWKRYARGNIEVHEVQCSHFEMDKSENIALIGEIVAAKIKELLP